MGIIEKYPRILDEVSRYPKPAKHLKYGTAGFREKAEILDSTFYRMGILALLRSRQQDSKIIGLMITASHNPEQDNGVKMVDPDGGMLAQAWEQYAIDLANAPAEKVPEVLDQIIEQEKIDLDKTGKLFIARDTRKSSEHLAELAREGALLVGGNVCDFLLQTTPQLHHLVRMFNYDKYNNKSEWSSEKGYYVMLAEAHRKILAGKDAQVEARGPLYVDAAHGIGAQQFTKLADHVRDIVKIEIRNPTTEGVLNLNCGAEYAQKARKCPEGFSPDEDKGKRCCSFDGDADRLVYWYFADDGEWKLIDGDKIAALCAMFLKEQLHTLGLDQKINLGAVQTAYANGASTKYIKSLGVTVPLAKTGVKFVHHKACEYDVGLYFEANGHGTVMFQDYVIEELRAMEATLKEEDKKVALTRLLAAYQLINQAVGDAMSDCLLVEAILAIKGWSVQDWDAIYKDLPSRQTKLPVKDRTAITCTDDETQVVDPPELQQEIEKLVAKYESGRAFVRPSGTEDVVRVYAEAATQELADELALAVARATHHLAGGVGEEPSTFVA